MPVMPMMVITSKAMTRSAVDGPLMKRYRASRKRQPGQRRRQIDQASTIHHLEMRSKPATMLAVAASISADSTVTQWT
jgi:hypothetical protein